MIFHSYVKLPEGTPKEIGKRWWFRIRGNCLCLFSQLTHVWKTPMKRNDLYFSAARMGKLIAQLMRVVTLSQYPNRYLRGIDISQGKPDNQHVYDLLLITMITISNHYICIYSYIMYHYISITSIDIYMFIFIIYISLYLNIFIFT